MEKFVFSENMEKEQLSVIDSNLVFRWECVRENNKCFHPKTRHLHEYVHTTSCSKYQHKSSCTNLY